MEEDQVEQEEVEEEEKDSDTAEDGDTVWDGSKEDIPIPRLRGCMEDGVRCPLPKRKVCSLIIKDIWQSELKMVEERLKELRRKKQNG